MRGGAFGFESGDIGGGWEAVQRHVDQKRVAACGGGARGGVEAFPIGAAGIVDVNVGIDEAGKDGGGGKIVDFGVGRDLIGGDDVEDAVSLRRAGRRGGRLPG